MWPNDHVAWRMRLLTTSALTPLLPVRSNGRSEVLRCVGGQGILLS